MSDSVKPFELGINYWPRRRAMYMWRELDLSEIRDELSHVADMGFDTVRLFALTSDFLPERERVDTVMVNRLVEVARIAKECGLAIVPTIVVINMSGTIWWPQWMTATDGARANLYEEPSAVRSQAMLAQACAGALAGDASVRAFDLANEIDDAQRPRTRAAGREWVRTLAAAVRGAAPGTPVRIGAHLPSLTTDNGMRVDDLAGLLDEDVMHAYPLYSEFARSFLDPELVPFACALTSALAGRGRLVLMQEFGLCTAPPGHDGHSITDDFLGQPRLQYLASESEAAEYHRGVVEGLAASGAAGAYPWCYADYDATLFDRPPLDRAIRERTFGLVRADGSEKPAAAVYRSLRVRRDAGGLVPASIPATIDVGADEYYTDPHAHFGRAYADWTGTLARSPR